MPGGDPGDAPDPTGVDGLDTALGLAVSVRTPAGSVLLSSSPAGTGSGPAIQPGETASFTLLLSNWCDLSVSLPLTFRLALVNGEAAIAGLSVTSTDDLPPCNAPGQPPGLTTSEWQLGQATGTSAGPAP
jgi:hypothetical protein